MLNVFDWLRISTIGPGNVTDEAPGCGGVLPYLTRRDVPLNRVSFYSKIYATGCPFLTKVIRQSMTIDKEIMRQCIMWKDIFRVLLKQWILAKILSDRVYF